jgi:protein OS-9
VNGEISDLRSADDDPADSESNEVMEDYERLVLKGKPYLCSLPPTNTTSTEEKADSASSVDQEKDLITAADRGWELLQDLEGKCLFFVSGWWSYSFCYNSEVKQFHQLPPGNEGPTYPPQEDPSTPSYVLGKLSNEKPDQRLGDAPSSVTTQLQTKGDSRYLVQKLGRGTNCDLTGEDRRVEVQFHCHPQSTDRIGWIKEVATCSYLMVVYTPRLCNEVAFSPPRQSKAHIIACREIVRPDEVAEWKSRKAAEVAHQLLQQDKEVPLMAGDIEIGAMKHVGREGRRIQIGIPGPAKDAEVVAMLKNGKLQRLSIAELERHDLDPKDVAEFIKKIRDLAGNKDWKIEKVDDEEGFTILKAVFADDEESLPGRLDAETEAEPKREGKKGDSKEGEGKEGKGRKGQGKKGDGKKGQGGGEGDREAGYREAL